MAHDVAAGPAKGKLVIRNIGLLLSGDLNKPILDADAIVVVDGRIAAIGKAADLDCSGADTVIDAKGSGLSPGLIDSHCHPVFGDWTPLAGRRAAPRRAAEPAQRDLRLAAGPGPLHAGRGAVPAADLADGRAPHVVVAPVALDDPPAGLDDPVRVGGADQVLDLDGVRHSTIVEEVSQLLVYFEGHTSRPVGL